MTKVSSSTSSSELGEWTLRDSAKVAGVLLGTLLAAAAVTERVVFAGLGASLDFKPSLVASGRVQAEVLVQGPSRALHSVDPRVLERRTGLSAYNMATNAASIDEQLTLLHLYLAHNKAPKLVLLEVHPGYLGENRLQFHPHYFLGFADDPLVRAQLEAHDPALRWLLPIPLAGFSRHNRHLLRESLKGLRPWFGLSPGRSNQVKGFQAKDRVWRNFASYSPNEARARIEPLEEHVQRYEQYIKLAQASGATVVVFTAPFFQEAWLEDSSLASLCARLKVRLWHFQNEALTQDPANFYDESHLNEHGAGVFSDVLAERLYLAREAGELP